MSVGSRIKELRKNRNLSRAQLANLLGITVSAVSNYENEISFPKEPLLFEIMKVLGCDANYLFQDNIDMPVMKNTVSVDEYGMIMEYRLLDAFGQETVAIALARESARVEQLKKRLLTYDKELKKIQGNKSQYKHTNNFSAPSMVAENPVSYNTNEKE